MTSLSDKFHTKDKAKDHPEKGASEPDEWKPLDVRHLESFDNESFFEPRHGRDESFSALYEADHPDDGSDTFAPFIEKKGDRPVDDEPDAHEDEIDREPHETAMESEAQEPEGDMASAAEAAPHQVPEPESPPEPPPDFEELKQAAFEEGFKKGEAEGFAKGEQDGLAAGRQQVEDIVNRLQGVLNGVEGLWGDLLGRYEDSIVRLVCRAAEKVVYGQAETDHDLVRRAILNAFEMIPNPEEITISVNPDDYEYIEAVKDDFFTLINGLKQVSVIADPGVARGGCQIESASGTVNADLDSRLEAIKESVMKVNKEKKAGGV